MAKKKKFYVVWVGHKPGVYSSWDEAKAQIEGFSGAKYKSFTDAKAAEEAYEKPADMYYGKGPKKSKTPKRLREELIEMGVDLTAIAVDAACKGNPGPLEYQGVDLESNIDLFHVGPLAEGTVNIGEFLAIVHALALLQNGPGAERAIYSDSFIGISWVHQQKCKTKLTKTVNNKALFHLVRRAEKWLAENRYKNPILKWETQQWGEIPADFGRK